MVAKISLANALEQAGEVDRAVALYQEVVALDGKGMYGSVSQKALEALGRSGHLYTDKELLLLHHEEKPKPQLSSPSLLERLRQGWENLNLRTKLTILLVGSAAIPVIIVTQAIDNVATERLLTTYKSKIKQQLSVLKEEVEKLQQTNQVVAATIAKSVGNFGLDLGNPTEVAAHRELLASFAVDPLQDKFGQSFHIITDDQGRTVAQYIQILDEDFSALHNRGRN